MSHAMLTRLVQIGNSRGVRIPKAVLDQVQLEGEIEMEVRDDEIILRPKSKARAGWEGAFASMHAAGDDEMILESGPSGDWDESEWEW